MKRKRDKKLWHKRKRCNTCEKGFNTWGGIKILCGLFKVKKWEHYCGCDTTTVSCYKNKIIVCNKNKKKCEEVLKEQNNDNKRTN